MPYIYLTSIVDSFKKLAENPGDAQKILETDQNFNNISNFTDESWYVGQLGYLLRDAQSYIGTGIVNALNLPIGLAKPLGICIPAILVLLFAWIIIRSMTKFFKAAIFITVIVFAVYIYVSTG